MRLEDVTPGTQILGTAGNAPVAVVAAIWIGGNALRLTYRTDSGKLDEQLLYRDHEGSSNVRASRLPCTTSRGDSGDIAGRDGSHIMAPWAIYPFCVIDCAGIICNLLLFDSLSQMTP
jgi:hypothetical protein